MSLDTLIKAFQIKSGKLKPDSLDKESQEDYYRYMKQNEKEAIGADSTIAKNAVNRLRTGNMNEDALAAIPKVEVQHVAKAVEPIAPAKPSGLFSFLTGTGSKPSSKLSEEYAPITSAPKAIQQPPQQSASAPLTFSNQFTNKTPSLASALETARIKPVPPVVAKPITQPTIPQTPARTAPVYDERGNVNPQAVRTNVTQGIQQRSSKLNEDFAQKIIVDAVKGVDLVKAGETVPFTRHQSYQLDKQNLMLPEEVGMYEHTWTKQSPAAAQEYYNKLLPELRKRETTGGNWFTRGVVAGGQGVEGAAVKIEDLYSKLSGNPVDQDIEVARQAQMTAIDAGRQNAAELNAQGGKISNYGGQATMVITEMIPSMVAGGIATAGAATVAPAAAIGVGIAAGASKLNKIRAALKAFDVAGKVGSATYGLQSVGSYARQAELDGADPKQQLAYGVVNGAIEAATEQVALFKWMKFGDAGIKKLFTNSLKKNLVTTAKSIATRMGSEGIQEAMMEPANDITGAAIYGKNIDVNDSKYWGELGARMWNSAVLGSIVGAGFKGIQLPGEIRAAIAIPKEVNKAVTLAKRLPENYASRAIAESIERGTEPVTYEHLFNFLEVVRADSRSYAEELASGTAGQAAEVQEAPEQDTAEVVEALTEIKEEAVAQGHEDIAQGAEEMIQKFEATLPEIQQEFYDKADKAGVTEQIREALANGMTATKITDTILPGKLKKDGIKVVNAVKAMMTEEEVAQIKSVQTLPKEPAEIQSDPMVETPLEAQSETVVSGPAEIQPEQAQIEAQAAEQSTAPIVEEIAPEANQAPQDHPDYVVVKTKHTETGEPLWVVKSASGTRLSDQDYKALDAKMKRMGSAYSKVTGGWNFKKDPSEIASARKVNLAPPVEVAETDNAKGWKRAVKAESADAVDRVSEPSGVAEENQGAVQPEPNSWQIAEETNVTSNEPAVYEGIDTPVNQDDNGNIESPEGGVENVHEARRRTVQALDEISRRIEKESYEPRRAEHKARIVKWYDGSRNAPEVRLFPAEVDPDTIGYYSKRTKIIYLTDAEGIDLDSAFYHELFHYYVDTATEQFKDTLGFVMESFNNKDVLDTYIERFSGEVREMFAGSKAALVEELYADAFAAYTKDRDLYYGFMNDQKFSNEDADLIGFAFEGIASAPKDTPQGVFSNAEKPTEETKPADKVHTVKSADEWESTSSKRQYENMKQIEAIMQSLGIEVKFFLDRSGRNINGYYSTGNVLHINKTLANPDNTEFGWFVTGHEFGHYLETQNPATYAKLLDYAKKNFSTDAVKLYEKNHTSEWQFGEMTAEEKRDAIIKEMLSDELGNAFHNTKFWEALNSADKTLFEKVVAAVKRFFEVMKGKLSDANTYRQDNGLYDAKTIATIQREFAQMVVAARRVNKAPEFNHDAMTRYKISAEHTTPHKFDKFDHSKMGTGEGAQVYGWGTYLSTSDEVREFYRKQFEDLGLKSRRSVVYDGEKIGVDNYRQFYGAEKLSAAEANIIREYIDQLSQPTKPSTAKASTEAKAFFEKNNKAGRYSDELTAFDEVMRKIEKPAETLKVDIDAEIEHMLDWDKPLSEQSEYVQERLKGTKALKEAEDFLRDQSIRAIGIKDVTGESLYHALSGSEGSDKAASLYLNSIGIPGIKYLDGMSRKKGEGSYNFVVFDESKMEIVDRYSTRTPEFKAWFGDSVVTVDGKPGSEPLVVWHGVKDADMRIEDGKVIFSSPFNIFDISKRIEPGAWFSPDKNAAAQYGTPVPFYLKAENPIQHEDPIEQKPEGHDAIYRMRSSQEGIQNAWEIAVFSPTQIKSATDNVGTYDPGNPDIRYSTRKTENIREGRELIEQFKRKHSGIEYNPAKYSTREGDSNEQQDSHRKHLEEIARRTDGMGKTSRRYAEELLKYAYDGGKVLASEAKTERQTVSEKVLEALGLKVIYVKTEADFGLGAFVFPDFPWFVFVREDEADTDLWSIIGHEASHAIQYSGPAELYKNLTDYADEMFTEKQIKARMRFEGLDESDPDSRNLTVNEMLADELGDAFTRRSFWAELFGKAPELAEKLAVYVDSMLSYRDHGLFNRHELADEALKDLQNEFAAAIAESRYSTRNPFNAQTIDYFTDEEAAEAQESSRLAWVRDLLDGKRAVQLQQKDADEGSFVVVAPSIKEDGIQISYFFKGEPWSDAQVKDIDEAAKRMADEGYGYLVDEMAFGTRAPQPMDPEQAKAINKEVNSLWDEMDAEDSVPEPQIETHFDESKEKTELLKTFDRLFSRGERVKLEDLKRYVVDLFENAEAYKTSLTKKNTIAELKKMVRLMHAYPPENKDGWVERIYKDSIDVMRTRLAQGDSIVTYGLTSWDKTAKEAFEKIFADLTQEKLNEIMDTRASEREAMIAKVKAPETLEDFRSAARIRTLTPEEKRRYEDLLAESKKEQTAKVEERKSTKVVPGLGERFTELEEAKNTKTGETLFNFKLAERAEKGVFGEVLSQVRKLGGGYWKGNFYFTTDSREDAQKKLDTLKSGGSYTKPEETAKAETKAKVDKTAEKLRALADGMQKTIDDKLAPRNTNTARRASMAAGVEADGLKLKKTQAMLRRIAEALEQGEFKFLDKLSSRAQVEQLSSLIRVAGYHWALDKSKAEGKRLDDVDRSSIPVEAIDQAQMPVVWADHMVSIAQKLVDKPGFKRDATTFIKRYQGNKGTVPTSEVASFMEKIKDTAEFKGSRVADNLADYRRLKALGIDSPATLRAALREFLPIFNSDGMTEQDKKEKSARELRRKEAELARTKIEGYFPTPPAIVEKMLEIANVVEGDRVLEPSAGAGHIADAVLRSEPGAKLDVVEWNGGLREVLQGKGYNVIGEDALQVEGQYDVIVMNPPFEKLQDVDHVRYAYDNNLAPGGRLVAIMSESPFYNSVKKAQDFREWLEEVDGWSEKLPEGAFKDSDRSTGVNTRIVAIEKPGSSKPRMLFSTRSGESEQPMSKRRDDSWPKTVSKYREQMSEDLRKILDGGVIDHGVYTDKKAIEDAIELIEKETEVVVMNMITDRSVQGSKVLFTAAELITQRYLNLGTEAGDQVALSLISAVSEKARHKGQAIQALSMWAKLSPEGILMHAKRTVGEGRNPKDKQKLDATVQDIIDAINRLNGTASGDVDIEAILKKLLSMTDGDKLIDKLEQDTRAPKKFKEKADNNPSGKEPEEGDPGKEPESDVTAEEMEEALEKGDYIQEEIDKIVLSIQTKAWAMELEGYEPSEPKRFDYLQKMIDAMVKEAGIETPKRNGEKPTALEKIVHAIRNKKAYRTLWLQVRNKVNDNAGHPNEREILEAYLGKSGVYANAVLKRALKDEAKALGMKDASVFNPETLVESMLNRSGLSGSDRTMLKQDSLKFAYEMKAELDRIAEAKAANKRKALSPGEQLARKVESTMKARVEKAVDPVRLMVDTLFKLTKESPLERPLKAKTATALQVVADAIKNREQYADVWEKAKAIVSEKLKDNPEALEHVDAYLKHGLGERTFANEQMDKATKESLKELEVKIRDVVKKHYSETKAISNTLAEKMALEAGLTGVEAEILAREVVASMDRLTTEAKVSELRRLFAKRKVGQRLSAADRIIQLSNLGAFSATQYQELVAEKLGMSALSPELQQTLREMANEIQTMPEGRGKTVMVARMLDVIAAQQPISFLRKMATFQTMAQLLNPKTWVRNVLGNEMFARLDRLSMTMAVPFDKLISKSSGFRTKVTQAETGTAFQEGRKEGWSYGFEDALLGIDTLEVNKLDLKPGRVFRDVPVLDYLEKMMAVELRAFDRMYYGASFRESLAEQVALSEDGVTTPEMLERAHLFALYRTFQDDTKLAGALRGFKDSLNLHQDFGLGDFLLKYTKTPANLLMRGMDYTPGVGFAIALLKLHADQTIDPYLIQKTKAESLGRQSVSVLLMALGYGLAALGVMSGSDDDDYETKEFLNQLGIGKYRINMTAVMRLVSVLPFALEDKSIATEAAKLQEGDVLTTYDWAMPSSLGLIIGADLMRKGKKTGWMNVFDFATATVGTSFEALSEQSMLRGLQQFFNSRGDGGSFNVAAGVNATLAGALSTFVPSIFGRTNTFLDDTVKDTKGDGVWDSGFKKAMAKTPGLAQMLPQKFTPLGEERRYYDPKINPLLKFVDQMLMPGFTKQYSPTEAEALVVDLYTAYKDPSIVPKQKYSSGRSVQLTYKKQSHTLELSPLEFQALSKTVGRETQARLMELIKSGVRKKDSEDQFNDVKSVLEDMGTFARKEALKIKAAEVEAIKSK